MISFEETQFHKICQFIIRESLGSKIKASLCYFFKVTTEADLEINF